MPGKINVCEREGVHKGRGCALRVLQKDPTAAENLGSTKKYNFGSEPAEIQAFQKMGV